MDISGLPHFIVEEIWRTSDDDARIVGRFSHLRGVRNDGGWLYRRPGPSLIGRLSRVPSAPGERVEFWTPDDGLAPELQSGATYPWIDHYWQAYHADMVLDAQWEPRTFGAAPARYFRLGGITGWQPEGGPLPDGAEDLGTRPGAWDHEHCEICRAQLSAATDPRGFVDPLDHWLCTTCYHRYAVARDLSFLAEA
jgi:hypothetical protein